MGFPRFHPGSLAAWTAAGALWLTLGCFHPSPRPAPPTHEALRAPALTRLGFSIQVGAFAQVENAARLTENLHAQGLEATYFLSGALYRVRFGDYANRETARTKAQALRAAGVIQDFYIVSPEEPEPGLSKPANERDLRENLVKTARGYLGVPYLWGGTTDKGFDCSGLAQGVYRLNGLKLPHSSREQCALGSAVAKENLQLGDLVFFATSGSGQVSHVGIYIGGGAFIHAPGRGRSICTEKLSDTYFQKHWVAGRTYF